MKTSAHLNSQIKKKVLYITLNSPEKHNCFGLSELQEIKNVLRENEPEPGVQAVVFKGAGDRSFSTGADLNQFKELDRQGTAEWIKKGHQVFNYIEFYPKPTLAVIQGYALGGGLELALACDFRIASENATFGCPELRHGWLPGWGGIHRLKKIAGQSKAKEIVFLAEQITADEAARIGLISHLTTPEQLEQKTGELLDKLLQLEPNVFAMAKAALSGPAYTDAPSSPDFWFDILSTFYSKKLT